MISEKELNSYRLTSMEEPTDEMLAQIMHEAAEIYNRENQEAHDVYTNLKVYHFLIKKCTTSNRLQRYA